MCSSLNEGLAVGSLGEFVEYSVFLVLISRPVSWQNVQTAFHSWSRWSLLLAMIVRSSQKGNGGRVDVVGLCARKCLESFKQRVDGEQEE